MSVFLPFIVDEKQEWEFNKHLCEVEIISLWYHLMSAEWLKYFNIDPVTAAAPFDLSVAPFEDSVIALFTVVAPC